MENSDQTGFAFLDILGYALPLLCILLIWSIYFWVPEFYFKYVLEERHREFQIIELITVVCAIWGGGLMVMGTWKLWMKNWVWAAAVVGVMALATLFFAGEEISWGQSYWGWSTPTWWRNNISWETNLHNSRISLEVFHGLAGLFQITMFVILPLIWMMRKKLGLPEQLKPAIPEYPVIFIIILAFVYRETKNVFRVWYSHDEAFKNFLWGMNEHREMLVAVGLLFYGLYKWQKTKELPYRDPTEVVFH